MRNLRAIGLRLGLAVVLLTMASALATHVEGGPSPTRAVLVVADSDNGKSVQVIPALRQKLKALREQGMFRGVSGLSQAFLSYDLSGAAHRASCSRLGILRDNAPYICIVELDAEGLPTRVVLGKGGKVTQVDQAVASLSKWLGLQGQAVARPSAAPATGRLQMEFAPVPGGKFMMGRNDGDESEAPLHPVTVKAFEIGKHEVTNAQFRLFVKATGHKAAGNWEEYAVKWGESAPVVCVSWHDAQAFCKWAGCRLPTEAEWEFAARGSEGRRYPWGNEWVPDHVVFSGNSGGGARPVGSRPSGASWCGAMDMAGNVWEWCSSEYKPYSYNGDETRENLSGAGHCVIRGGSWGSVESNCHGTFRGSDPPGYSFHGLGFRCARSAT